MHLLGAAECVVTSCVFVIFIYLYLFIGLLGGPQQAAAVSACVFVITYWIQRDIIKGILISFAPPLLPIRTTGAHLTAR
jgi:hypothetical protein